MTSLGLMSLGLMSMDFISIGILKFDFANIIANDNSFISISLVILLYIYIWQSRLTHHCDVIAFDSARWCHIAFDSPLWWHCVWLTNVTSSRLTYQCDVIAFDLPMWRHRVRLTTVTSLRSTHHCDVIALQNQCNVMLLIYVLFILIFGCWSTVPQ